MKVRIISKGWETFSGSFGHKAVFHDGVSVDDLNARQIARIGSSVQIVDADTGEQVGPSSAMIHLFNQTVPVIAPLADGVEREATEAEERKRLADEAAERKVADAEALVAAEAKRQAQEDAFVIYSRAELEAIGANDGIAGLREIATPLKVKARAITEMVTEILAAQSKLAVG